MEDAAIEKVCKNAKIDIPSGINMDRASRTIFTKSATNMLSAFLPMKK
jgi:NAD(P)H-hydrate repair Nnr-like enzyme with NAD(P)H-hydrate epimerase domain